jgi:hypothetical protein
MNGLRNHGNGWGILAVCLWMLATGLVQAHTASTAWLELEPDEARTRVVWRVALTDLAEALDLDANGDGLLTWDEYQAAEPDIERFLASGLAVSAGGAKQVAREVEHQIDRERDGGMAVLTWMLPGVARGTAWEVEYGLFFAVDPLHRLLVRVGPSGGNTAAAVLSPATRTTTLVAGNPGTSAGRFVQEGMHHIWEGYDHLAFLLALLLPAVFQRGPHGWTPVVQLGPVVRQILQVITAFTLAHSLTLALGAFGWLHLSERWVESVIAASIGVAALGNLLPGGQGAAALESGGKARRWGRPWHLALGFGLVHGLGFAGVLTDLGLSRASLWGPLLGFNAGVELGQLACVAAFLPLAYFARRTLWYRRLMLQGGSAALLVLSAVWCVQRVTG